ncbi:MAG TPA: DUF3887 domain-containing protein [Chloroflexi bacterium]|jgi:histidyl-tRNA synthetase|nr:DUF3887 domain-containing protein [Chloroflexota bacterium]
MVKNKTYKTIYILLMIAFSLGVLVGCAAKLPEGFDEADVKAEAENVIRLLDHRDMDGLTNILTEEMKAGLTEEVMAQIFSVLDESGSVETIEEMKTGGSTQNDITYAVVVAKVKHENRELTYTISFDSEMKLAGLFFK